MILTEWSDIMFLIRLCGVDLYKTDNLLEFVTKLKEYQLKFGIDSVETICTDSNTDVSSGFSIPNEITLNVIISFKN